MADFREKKLCLKGEQNCTDVFHQNIPPSKLFQAEEMWNAIRKEAFMQYVVLTNIACSTQIVSWEGVLN